MKNNVKVSICLVAIIFLFGTLLMSNVAFAQTEQNHSVTVTVTDIVTGKAAEGVTTLIRSSSGTEIQNLGVVPQGGTQVSLPSGQYSFIVQIEIFGAPVALITYPIDITQPTSVSMTVSAYFIPIQYLPLLIYIIIIIVILAILIFIIRRLRKPKKPVPETAVAKT